ncbi:uncharacterized protein BJ171DRAFT_122539 [Polychytrium aggregatum]|uniref:uncharacterized protein n=1 Tax=Polychytrium aggregatum TaxID=110093 RepID=UPI0022FF39DE|nr:uncharacterized protein BJ171DRAFT_122539 [Polychytrium aggregatum]KAI9204297.1 hypothetical protein BJ171DRAFT_122539 [Polychytrium aggregatum]
MLTSDSDPTARPKPSLAEAPEPSEAPAAASSSNPQTRPQERSGPPSHFLKRPSSASSILSQMHNDKLGARAHLDPSRLELSDLLGRAVHRPTPRSTAGKLPFRPSSRASEPPASTRDDLDSQDDRAAADGDSVDEESTIPTIRCLEDLLEMDPKGIALLEKRQDARLKNVAAKLKHVQTNLGRDSSSTLTPLKEIFSPCPGLTDGNGAAAAASANEPAADADSSESLVFQDYPLDALLDSIERLHGATTDKEEELISSSPYKSTQEALEQMKELQMIQATRQAQLAKLLELRDHHERERQAKLEQLRELEQRKNELMKLRSQLAMLEHLKGSSDRSDPAQGDSGPPKTTQLETPAVASTGGEASSEQVASDKMSSTTHNVSICHEQCQDQDGHHQSRRTIVRTTLAQDSTGNIVELVESRESTLHATTLEDVGVGSAAVQVESSHTSTVIEEVRERLVQINEQALEGTEATSRAQDVQASDEPQASQEDEDEVISFEEHDAFEQLLMLKQQEDEMGRLREQLTKLRNLKAELESKQCLLSQLDESMQLSAYEQDSPILGTHRSQAATKPPVYSCADGACGSDCDRETDPVESVSIDLLSCTLNDIENELEAIEDRHEARMLRRRERFDAEPAGCLSLRRVSVDDHATLTEHKDQDDALRARLNVNREHDEVSLDDLMRRLYEASVKDPQFMEDLTRSKAHGIVRPTALEDEGDESKENIDFATRGRPSIKFAWELYGGEEEEEEEDESDDSQDSPGSRKPVGDSEIVNDDAVEAEERIEEEIEDDGESGDEVSDRDNIVGSLFGRDPKRQFPSSFEISARERKRLKESQELRSGMLNARRSDIETQTSPFEDGRAYADVQGSQDESENESEGDDDEDDNDDDADNQVEGDEGARQNVDDVDDDDDDDGILDGMLDEASLAETRSKVTEGIEQVIGHLQTLRLVMRAEDFPPGQQGSYMALYERLQAQLKDLRNIKSKIDVVQFYMDRQKKVGQGLGKLEDMYQGRRDKDGPEQRENDSDVADAKVPRDEQPHVSDAESDAEDNEPSTYAAEIRKGLDIRKAETQNIGAVAPETQELRSGEVQSLWVSLDDEPESAETENAPETSRETRIENEENIVKKGFDFHRRRVELDMQSGAVRELDGTSEHRLFDQVKSEIHRDAAAVIAQFDTEPYFLMMLFRNLKKMDSVYLRQRLLLALDSILEDRENMMEQPLSPSEHPSRGKAPMVRFQDDQAPPIQDTVSFDFASRRASNIQDHIYEYIDLVVTDPSYPMITRATLKTIQQYLLSLDPEVEPQMPELAKEMEVFVGMPATDCGEDMKEVIMDIIGKAAPKQQAD